MNYKLIASFSILVLMSSCKTQNTETNSEKEINNNSITLDLSKSSKIPKSNITLQFKEITEESRCPVDVNCVWEGIAIINIEGIAGKEKKDFQVATRDFPPKNVTNTFVFSGYKFILTELKPQPGGKAEPTSVTFKYEKVQ